MFYNILKNKNTNNCLKYLPEAKRWKKKRVWENVSPMGFWKKTEEVGVVWSFCYKRMVRFIVRLKQLGKNKNKNGIKLIFITDLMMSTLFGEIFGLVWKRSKGMGNWIDAWTLWRYFRFFFHCGPYYHKLNIHFLFIFFILIYFYFLLNSWKVYFVTFKLHE